MKLSDLNIGSVVKVATDFGSGRVVTGVVVELESDIKNGYPGISYDLPDGDGGWAYLHQVKSIVKK
jgi:hypothetical protein